MSERAARPAGRFDRLQSASHVLIVACDWYSVLAGGRMFDPYHRWLGIAKEEQPPTYYRLLGINPSEEDPEVIEEAAIRQTTHVRTNQLGPHADHCTRLLNEIARARSTLLDPEKRRQYDATLAAKTERPRQLPQAGKQWLYAAAALGVVVVGVLVWVGSWLLSPGKATGPPTSGPAAKGPKGELNDPPVVNDPRVGSNTPTAAGPGKIEPKEKVKETKLGQPVAAPSALVPEKSRRKGSLTGKGTWRIEGEHLVSDGKPSVLVFGDPQWKDYDFSFVAERLTGEGGFAAIFRSRHGADQKDSYAALFPGKFGNGLFFTLQQRDGGTLYQAGDKKGKGLPGTFAGKDFRIEPGQEYRINISLRKADCECFLNDKRVLKYVKLEYEHGAVGIRNLAGGTVRVRDIMVRGADGQVLWQGPPSLE
jgi:hypothetical protein